MENGAVVVPEAPVVLRGELFSASAGLPVAAPGVPVSDDLFAKA